MTRYKAGKPTFRNPCLVPYYIKGKLLISYFQFLFVKKLAAIANEQALDCAVDALTLQIIQRCIRLSA